MIGYIVSGTVLAVSSVFNVGMTIYKHKDTIRKITKKFNEDEQINKLIKKIVIHKGVTKIDQETFKGMNYQKIEVELPDTLTEIGEGAFENNTFQ